MRVFDGGPSGELTSSPDPRPSTLDPVEVARTWLGTPYQHGASVRGVGCDCLGLVRGVWRARYRAEPEAAPPYAPDWAEGGRELLLEALGRRFEPARERRVGDVLAFRMAEGAAVKHLAILSAPDRIVHAYWGRAVVESWLQPWWERRVDSAWRFPILHREAGEGDRP